MRNEQKEENREREREEGDRESKKRASLHERGKGRE